MTDHQYPDSRLAELGRQIAALRKQRPRGTLVVIETAGEGER